MLLMFVVWKLVKRTKFVKLEEMDLETDVYTVDEDHELEPEDEKGWKGKAKTVLTWFF